MCAMLLFLHEAIPDGLLHRRIGDDDVMPGLRVGARRRMASRLEDHLKVFARHVAGRECAVRHAIAHHVH